MRRTRLAAVHGWLLFTGLLVLQACSNEAVKPTELTVGAYESSERSLFANGDFESGASANPNVPVGWTMSPNINNGPTNTTISSPPTSLAALNLAAGGYQAGAALGPNTTLSQGDPDLGTSAGFRYPRFGTYAAVANYSGATANGNNKNINTLSQTMTVGLGDIDPTDGQLHVRFAYAPVLEYPSHPFQAMPYYFVNLVNVTQGTTLYSQFNIAGQQGVPWTVSPGTRTGTQVQWLNWTLADITSAQGSFNIGDSVQLNIAAAGCSAGAHFGRIYVDGVGMQVPGPYVSASAPAQAALNANITYKVHVANGSTSAANGTLVTINLPQNTNFVAVSPASSCVSPAVGAPGPTAQLICPLGKLSPSSSYDFNVTVQVQPGAPSILTLGTYSVSASGYSALNGAPVNTSINAGRYADVAVACPSPVSYATWGQSISYQMVVTNQSPNALTAGSVNVAYEQPAQFAGLSWTCAPTTACVNPNGTGSLSEFPALAASASVTYTINANVVASASNANVTSTFIAPVVANAIDPLPLNNNQAVNFNIGSATSVLTLNKTGSAASGTVAVTPNGAACGTACSNSTFTFITGTSVLLSANPIPNATFSGWTGGGCTGTTPTCTVTLSAATTVTANFTAAPAAGAAATILVVGGDSQYAAANSNFLLPVSVMVFDASGIPLSGASVNWSTVNNANAVFQGGTLTTQTTTTQTTGLSQVYLRAGANTNAKYGITATSGAATLTITETNTGTPATISFVEGGVSTADYQFGTSNSQYLIPLVARVADSAGNPIPNVTVTYTPPTQSYLTITSPVTVVTDGAGLSSLYVTGGTIAPGNAYVTVAATAPGATGNVTFYLSNLTYTPGILNYVSGNNQAVTASSGASTFTFSQPLSVALAESSYGTVLGGIAVTFTVNPNNGATGTLSSPTAITNSAGVAAVTVTSGSVYGTYSVVASYGSLPSITFTLSNEGTQYINVVSGTPQTTTVGTAFPSRFAIKVTDNTGAAVSGAAVSFTAPGSGATVSFSANANTTDATGTTYVTGNANSVTGSYQVNVTTPNSTRPAIFKIANTPGSVTSLTIGTGANQNTTVNTAFAAPLSVTAFDQYGNKVPNATVTWSAGSAGAASATLSSASTVTDANGFTSITANANTVANAAAYTVSAKVGAVTANFTLKNVPAAPSAIVVSPTSSTTSPIYLAQGTASSALTAAVQDQYGNSLPNVNVTFTVNPNATTNASATVTGGTTTYTTTTAASSPYLATTTANANTRSGPYSITVTSPGVTTPQTIYFSNYGTPSTFTLSPASSSTSPLSTVVMQPFTSALMVTVLDNSGYAVPGASVTFTVPSSGASATLSPSATQTSNSAGQVSVVANANAAAGAYVVKPSTAGITSGFTFFMANTPAALSTVAHTDNQNQSTVVGTSFSGLGFIATDSYGNPISGAAVSFIVPAAEPNAVISPLTYSTDGNGKVNTPSEIVAAVAGHKVGTYPIVAKVGTVNVNWNLTNTVGSLNAVVAFQGATQNGNVNTAYATQLGVQVQDVYGNPVPSAAYSFTCISSAAGACATLSPSSGSVGTDGNILVTANANTIAGQFVIKAMSGTATAATFTFTNLAASPNHIVLPSTGSGNNQNAIVNTAFATNLSVVVTDVYNNPVKNATVTFTVPGTGASATFSSGSTAITDATGTAKIGAFANRVADSQQNPNTYVVTAAVNGLSPANFTLTNNPGAATAIVLSPNTTSSAPLSAVVNSNYTTPLGAQVVDVYGNPIAGQAVTFTVNANATTNAGATLNGTSPYVASTAGAPPAIAATVSANPNAGNYTVTATSGTLPAQTLFLQNTGQGNALTILAGNNQNAIVGQTFATNLQVQLVDTSGNGVPDAQVVFTVPTGDPNATMATYTYTTSNTGTVGSVSAPITAGQKVGTYQVTATCQGFAQTFTLSNTVGAASQIVTVAGASPQQGTAGQAYPQALAAVVQDAYGNPVTGATVSFTMFPSSGGAGATLSAASATSDQNGNAGVTANANALAGTFTVKATTIVGAAIVSTTFTLTNVAAAPATLTIGAGDNQSAVVGATFNANLVVHVVDQYGNPIVGGSVTFVSPTTGAGASFSPAVATTDASGNANVAVTANNTSGSYAVNATIGTVSLSTPFSLRNLAGPGVVIVTHSGTPQSTPVLTAFAPLVAEVEDAFGNPAPNSTVNFWATGPTSLAQTRATSDANGLVTVNATAQTSTQGSQVVALLANNANAVFVLSTTPGPVVALVADPNDAGGLTAKTGTVFARPLGLVAVDAFGNPVPNTVIVFAPPSSGASATLAASQATTDSAGHVQITANAGATPGDYVVNAHPQGATSPIAAFQLSNAVTSPLALVADPNAEQHAQVTTAFASPLTVQVLDASGNPVVGKVVHFAAPASGATATLSSNVVTTDSSGNAQVTATAGNASGGVYYVTASVSGASSSSVFAMVNQAGPATTLSADAAATPQKQLVNGVFGAPLKVTAYDAQGNPTSDGALTFTVPASTGASAAIAGGGLNSSNNMPLLEDGTGVVVATANGTTGNYNINVGLVGTSNLVAFNLTNGAKAGLVLAVTGGASQTTTVGTNYPSAISFQVTDPNGAVKSGAAITVTSLAKSGGASCTAASTLTTDASGNANTLLTANDIAGVYTVVATVGAGTTPVEFLLNNVAGAPAAIAFAPSVTSGSGSTQQQSLRHFFGIPLSVVVTDQYGNPVVGTSVVFDNPASQPNAVLSSTSVTTDATGTGQVLAIAGGTSGAYQVVADTSGTSVGGVVFQLTNLDVVGANSIALVSGGSQTAIAGTQFAQPVVFVVYDGSEYAAPGVMVTLASDAGVSFDPTSATTDASGQVSATVTAGSKPGTSTITATESGAQSTATTSLTVQLIPTTTTVANANNYNTLGIPLNLVAQVKASAGTLAPTGSVRFVSDANGTLGTVTLDATGTATLSTDPPRVGSHDIKAQYQPTGPFEPSQSDTKVLVIDTGWRAIGNNCAQGSTQAWVLGLLAAAMLAWRAHRRRHV